MSVTYNARTLYEIACARMRALEGERHELKLQLAAIEEELGSFYEMALAYSNGVKELTDEPVQR